MRALIRILALLVLGISFTSVHLIGTIFVAGDAVAQDVFPGLLPFSVQMHLHGHSNHNASAKPASMQWQFAQASIRSGTDVLWWTDHTPMFSQEAAPKRYLHAGRLDPKTLDLVDFGIGDSSVAQLAATVSGRMPTVFCDGDGLHIGVRSVVQDSEWQWIRYEAKGEKGAIFHSMKWNKPISSGAIFELEVSNGALDPDNLIEVSFDLSYHYYDKPVKPQLIFQFVPATEAPQQLFIGADQVLTTIPYSPEQEKYSLDLLSASSLLRDGDDNTVMGIAFRFGARNGKSLHTVLKSFSIRSSLPEPKNQLEAISALAKRYETEYGLRSYVGVENGGADSINSHFNAFLPSPMDDIALTSFSQSSEEFYAWLDKVHERGGLVSLNHIFGTSQRKLLSAQERKLLIKHVARRTIKSKAMGTDLMEVGYLARGGFDIGDHLKIWDILTVNGLFLVGTGVTDTHGGDWNFRMSPNPFTTWVLADNPEQDSLIDGLKQGRAYFGNGFLWDGIFAFTVGKVRMGERASIQADSLELKVQLEPWPAGMKVFLVQGILKPRMDVEYLHSKTPIRKDKEIIIDTTRSSFVRLEAYKADRKGNMQPVVFTNPALLLRKQL